MNKDIKITLFREISLKDKYGMTYSGITGSTPNIGIGEKTKEKSIIESYASNYNLTSGMTYYDLADMVKNEYKTSGMKDSDFIYEEFYVNMKKIDDFSQEINLKNNIKYGLQIE